MVRTSPEKRSDKLIPRCVLFDSIIWQKVKELANQEGRSISNYLREQIKILYAKSKKPSLINS